MAQVDPTTIDYHDINTLRALARAGVKKIMARLVSERDTTEREWFGIFMNAGNITLQEPAWNLPGNKKRRRR